MAATRGGDPRSAHEDEYDGMGVVGEVVGLGLSAGLMGGRET